MFKKLVSFTLFCLSIILGQAQNSYPVAEFDLLKLGVTSVSKYGGGLLVGSELRYNSSQKFSLGLKADLVFLGNRTDLPRPLGQDGLETDCISSFALLGDYKFSGSGNNTFLLGTGFGYINGFGRLLEDSSYTPMIRGGFSLYGLRVVAEYTFSLDDGVPSIFVLTMGYPIRGGADKLDIKQLD